MALLGMCQGRHHHHRPVCICAMRLTDRCCVSAVQVPWGLRKLLKWIDTRYHHPIIYVTENGWSTPGDEHWSKGVQDDGRVLFYHNYTSEMQVRQASKQASSIAKRTQLISLPLLPCIVRAQRSINEDGVDLRGYLAWSLMDNFECERGYTERFGLVFTDFDTQERDVKASGGWYKAAIEANAIVDPCPFLTDADALQAAGCKADGSIGSGIPLIFAIFAFTSILIVIGLKLRSYLMPPKYPKGNLMESAPEVAGSEEDDRE